MRTRVAAALGLLLAVALAVSACGGASNGRKVASAGGTAKPSASATAKDNASDQEKMLEYAKCMRANGVPNFPDPQFNGNGGVGISVPDGTDPKTVDAANTTCKRYLPNGGAPPSIDPAQLEQLRKFAQCMRDHGITNFPDPTANGLQVNGNTLGIDPTDPRMKAADAACAQFQPSHPAGAAGGQTTQHNG